MKRIKVVCNEKKGKSGRLPILGTYVSVLGVSLGFSCVPSYFFFYVFPIPHSTAKLKGDF